MLKEVSLKRWTRKRGAGQSTLALDDLAPLAEGKVARHQNAATLVAFPKDAKEQFNTAAADRDISQLDQQMYPIELGCAWPR